MGSEIEELKKSVEELKRSIDEEIKRLNEAIVKISKLQFEGGGEEWASGAKRKQS